MINATYLNHNEVTFFRTVIAEKGDPRKTLLQGISARVLRGYRYYLNDFEKIVRKPGSIFTAMEVSEKEALNHCYSTATQSFSTMKGAIRNAQNGELKHTCPYCLIDRPTTIDHYIGKTEFPEFSILVKNLIPCCASCNNLKRDTWRNGGVRQFIHYYNDTFLHKTFLHGQIDFPGNGTIPVISFSLRKGRLSANEFKIVQAHFTNLNLFVFYESKANSAISVKMETLGDSINNNIIKRRDAKSLLLSESRKSASRLGINFWEAVMFEAMANCPKLIRLL
jgi:hypothetical protein